MSGGTADYAYRQGMSRGVSLLVLSEIQRVAFSPSAFIGVCVRVGICVYVCVRVGVCVCVNVMEYNNCNGPIRWRISTSIKVIIEHFSIVLTVLQILAIQILWLENVGQNHDVRHS